MNVDHSAKGHSTSANAMVEGILVTYFGFGLILAFFYSTWLVGIGVGALILGLYYTGKIIFVKSNVHPYIASVGLALFMAQFIYQMHGLFEMHFTAFIGAIALIIYQNWRVFIPFTLAVAVHHASFAYIQYYGFVNNVPQYKNVYFSQLDYMTFQTFLFHVVLFVFAVLLAGWYANYMGKLNKKNESDIKSLESFKGSTNRNIAFANAISKGEYGFSHTLQEDDELGNALENMRNNLLESQMREKQDRFLNLGLAEISDIIRKNEGNLHAMCDQLISYLVVYLKANQGALFVVQEDANEKFLELKSCYAYDRKKFLHKKIEIGQGMVGQCYLEKQTNYMRVIPKDYVRITSGLGEATPKTLVLVPMISNEVVEGVMEFASFQEIEPYQISFLEKVGESIAASINTASVNERIKHLYTESQQQTEEMRAQEEEMRQNMEELAATQEELGRNANKMQDQIRAMDNGNLAIAEFDTKGNILEANNSFLKVMNYQLHEVSGHHHRMFVDDAYADSDTYATFWKELASGKAHSGLINRKGKHGKKVVLAATYAPLADSNGNVYRVIKYALDMTDVHMNGKSKNDQVVEEISTS